MHWVFFFSMNKFQVNNNIRWAIACRLSKFVLFFRLFFLSFFFFGIPTTDIYKQFPFQCSVLMRWWVGWMCWFIDLHRIDLRNWKLFHHLLLSSLLSHYWDYYMIKWCSNTSSMTIEQTTLPTKWCRLTAKTPKPKANSNNILQAHFWDCICTILITWYRHSLFHTYKFIYIYIYCFFFVHLYAGCNWLFKAIRSKLISKASGKSENRKQHLKDTLFIHIV